MEGLPSTVLSGLTKRLFPLRIGASLRNFFHRASFHSREHTAPPETEINLLAHSVYRRVCTGSSSSVSLGILH